MLAPVKYILNHPLTKKRKIGALVGFVKWQFFSRLFPYPIVFPFTEHSKLLIWKGLTGATGNLYCGLHEFEDMSFLLHLLREGDLFIDIGANIGSYTILASAEITANTISIEPIPTTYFNLTQNIAINNINDKVKALNIGLGGKKGVLKFTKSLDTVNHVADNNETDLIDVTVDTLDNVVGDKKPLLLKIDVEGFETEVLNGANSTLRSPGLKAIIIELNGSGGRYGFDESKIHTMLIGYGFQAVRYDPFKRELTKVSTYGSYNTIYVRDIDFVIDKLKSAKKIKVQRYEI